MLEWNVIYEDFNAKKITTHNVFEHHSFLEDCKKFAKKYKNDRKQFEENVQRSLMYYYWSKCEWEVIVSSWPEGRSEKKIDVYDQVMMNVDKFMDYLWENKKDL